MLSSCTIPCLALFTLAGVAVVACGTSSPASDPRSDGSGGSGHAGLGGTMSSISAAGGGDTGAGGSVAKGGATGSGSSASTGGSSGTGGSTSKGGSSGSKGGSSGIGDSTSKGGGSDASGSTARGGASGSGGSVSTGGASGTAGTNTATTEHFSFFVTSLKALQQLSGSDQGFGGDLRFGKADGLSGADEICRQIAEKSMPGAGSKTWHAFLSVTKGSDSNPVNAIDRVGQGPWYDRLGRLFAATKADLLYTRPNGGDAAIVNDFPNEDGVPNHNPDGTGQVDNHDMLTGSNASGQVYGDKKSTCQDWTSSVGSDGKPRVGHSWPRSGGGGGGRGGQSGGTSSGGGMENWMSALDEAGCAPGVSLIETGGPIASNPTVGSGGGYGGFYCFALTP
jgi:hypothetical protein